MSAESVRRALKAFLDNRKPSVLAISGAWGVGKTHVWQEFVREHAHRTDGGYSSYSYVSLFGLTSLSELEQHVAFEAVGIDQVSRGPAALTLLESDSRVRDKARRLVQESRRWLIGAGGRLLTLGDVAAPYVNTRPLLGPLARWASKKRLVCIDDLERRGRGLELRDIMGYATRLRDACESRVVILLNVDQLDVNEAEDLQLLHEKVFDCHIRLTRSPRELAELVLPLSGGDAVTRSHRAIIIDKLDRLGVANARVILKTYEFWLEVYSCAEGKSESLVTELIHALPLLVLARFSTDKSVPSLDFVRGTNLARAVRLATPDAVVDPLERKWSELLDAYEFHECAAVESVLCDSLVRGYIDISQLNRAMDERESFLAQRHREDTLEDAWRLFRESFSSNTDEVAEALADAGKSSGPPLALTAINGIVSMLRSLGRSGDADAVVLDWIDRVRKEQPELLNLAENAFQSDVDDSMLRSAVEEAWSHSRRLPTLADAVRSLENSRGWSDEALEVISRASARELEAVFRELRGPGLRRAIQNCIEMSKMSSSDPRYTRIKSSVPSALTEIARDGPLNRRRIQALGLHTEPTENE